VHPFGEFIVIPFDPLVDASPLLAHVLSEPPKPRSKTVALIRQYLRQIPLELASPCGTVMPRSSMSARS
jgi:hypothetical protein